MRLTHHHVLFLKHVHIHNFRHHKYEKDSLHNALIMLLFRLNNRAPHTPLDKLLGFYRYGMNKVSSHRRLDLKQTHNDLSYFFKFFFLNIKNNNLSYFLVALRTIVCHAACRLHMLKIEYQKFFPLFKTKKIKDIHLITYHL